MADYSFTTIWKFQAPVEKVWNQIHDADNWTNWWRGVKSVIPISSGDQFGIGGAKRFVWKSFLPYELTFESRIVSIDPLSRIEGLAYGDLDGRGVWTFTYDRSVTTVQYDWQVKTTKWWMNFLEPIAKPVFAWNHDVVMRWGGEGLAKQLGCPLL